MNDTVYFDDKQKSLIHAWHNMSLDASNPYLGFMTEWIAFNAICYNLYHEQAVMYRANIDTDKSKLRQIAEQLSQSAQLEHGKAVLKTKQHKWTIDIKFPERLHLLVEEKYTEDRIFYLFAHSTKYAQLHKEQMVTIDPLFENLKRALTKTIRGHARHYVINMARVNRHSYEEDVDKMAERNIVVCCEENTLPVIKNVLYQIRCNIFHGEKTPGEYNDDSIVRQALPLLRILVEWMLKAERLT